MKGAGLEGDGVVAIKRVSEEALAGGKGRYRPRREESRLVLCIPLPLDAIATADTDARRRSISMIAMCMYYDTFRPLCLVLLL